jgi:hypothetical protein
MAHKVSYKVVSEQGEQLKKTAKDMDNYVTQLNQIVSKLGSDELLQSVRADLNKFKALLEEEKTILNLAGQVITDVVQSYTGTEKKSVSKVDKTKAHNRDFYKRPKTVASAGGGGASSGGASSVNINVSESVSYTNTTNVFSDMGSQAAGAAGAAGGMAGAAASAVGGLGGLAKEAADMVTSKGGAAAAGILGVTAAGLAAAAAVDKKNEKKGKEE